MLKKVKKKWNDSNKNKKSFEILNLKKKTEKSTATIYSRKNKNTKISINSNYKIKLLNKVTIQEIKEFTEDFYFLKQSNFSNSHALSTIINKTESLYFKEVLKDILTNVENNETIYKSMKKYKTIFPTSYQNFIKTGELTGNLEGALKSAIIYLEDEEKIKNKIQGELVPNLIAFWGILVILFLVLLIGIPYLQNIFESYGNEVALPKITISIFGVVNFIIKYWYLFILLILCMIGIFIKLINTQEGKKKLDKFKYNNFLFGDIAFLLDFSRIIKSLYLNLEQNMKIQYALEICKNFISNSYMLDLVEKSINNVYTGKSWIEPFEKEKKLSSIIIELLKNFNKLNSIEIMRKAAEYLEKDLQKETDRVLKKLPVISYGIVGIVLLLFIIMILIPCMQIYLGGLLIF